MPMTTRPYQAAEERKHLPQEVRVRNKELTSSHQPGFCRLGLFAFQALPALACGGLIAPDGDVRLDRATTFVAWHDGIERYMTAFTYQGDVANVGSLVTQCS